MSETTEGSLASVASSYNTLIDLIGVKGYFYAITINPIGLNVYGNDITQEAVKNISTIKGFKKIILAKETSKKNKIHAHGVLVMSNRFNGKNLQNPKYQVYTEKLRPFFKLTRSKECLCKTLHDATDDPIECPHRWLYKPEHFTDHRTAWFHYMLKESPDNLFYLCV